MADITVTAANVGPAFPGSARIRSFLAGAAIQGGQAVYIDSNGLAQLTAGGATTTSNFAGIALPRMNTAYAAGAGQAVEVLQEGEVEGFALSGLAYYAPVYLSNTSGTLGSTAGTHGQGIIGVVVPTSDKDSSGNPRKVLRLRDPINTASA